MQRTTYVVSSVYNLCCFHAIAHKEAEAKFRGLRRRQLGQMHDIRRGPTQKKLTCFLFC